MAARVVRVPGVVEATRTVTYELPGGETVYLAGPDTEPVFLGGQDGEHVVRLSGRADVTAPCSPMTTGTCAPARTCSGRWHSRSRRADLMTWFASGIFQQAMLNPLLSTAWTTAAPTGYGSLSADVIKVALFGTNSSPAKSATAFNTCYANSQWTVGNETSGGANWPAGGLPLASKAFTVDTASSSACFQGAPLAGTGNVTVTGAYGVLVYDSTITSPANQGLCFNYFGSGLSQTAGVFTVLWSSVGALSNVVVLNVSV